MTGASGYTIPEGNKTVSNIDHLPVPDNTGTPTILVPVGNKPSDLVTSLSGIPLTKQIRSSRSSADDNNLMGDYLPGENGITAFL